ncbi:hypothetical protein B0H15DRAFT_609990 [Mycena belliarum]|uniref:Protein kinase domain-containing protein n=1 Tax=Mycena belliarum TaxID=1033014 RepID=A0AAD6XFM0_9AGAR|nr:hypothetical protein B0H15DRAFT_609990 [Mycena belliae]
MPRPIRRYLPDPMKQYHVSRKFGLQAHLPPPVPEEGLRRMLFSQEDLDIEMQPNGRLENCRRHAVRPATIHPSIEISLEQPLTTGLSDLRCAQVWKVMCMGKPMVARFFDPLYVEDLTGRCDIFKRIDRAVALECMAYKALENLQGAIVPRFVGCFLTMVAAPDGVENNFERGVYVLLMEFIPGHDLRSPPEDEDYLCDLHKAAILDAISLAQHLIVLHGVH